MKKRIISLVCSLALAFSLAVPAFAKEVKQTEVPVTLTVINAAQRLSVTVPAALPVSVVEGTVVTANNAAITNNAETGAIRVAAVEVRPGALEIENFADFGNRTNTIALSLNDCTTAQAGELPITQEAFPDIEAGKSLPIRYTAKVSTANAAKAVSVTTSVNTGAKATAPSYTPVKAGHTFKGWYTSATGGNLYSTVTISAAQTFYAQFTANSYTATWNANGGTPASTTTSPSYGAKLTLPTQPTKAGYAFAGWYTAVTGGTQVTSSTTYNTAGNVTYYAHWTTNSYTVTWNMGDGKTETTNQGYGEKLVMPSGSPMKTGHTFLGWFTAEKGGTEVTENTTYTTAGTATYYAQFTANHYSITWDLGDGKTETTGQTYGEKLILPTEPTKDGYSFLGWFTEKEDGKGTKVDENTIYTNAGVGNYYAHWARVTKFSVAVPVVLPLAVSENGEIHAATGQAIRNSSTGDIRVSSVTVNAGNGWKLVPFTTNMAAEKVDAKKIGFSINDIETTKNGSSEALRLSGDWTIKEAGNLPLEYDAVVSAMSKSVTDESILTVVFVLEWA